MSSKSKTGRLVLPNASDVCDFVAQLNVGASANPGAVHRGSNKGQKHVVIDKIIDNPSGGLKVVVHGQGEKQDVFINTSQPDTLRALLSKRFKMG